MKEEAGVTIANYKDRVRRFQDGRRALIIDGHIPQVFGNDVLTVKIDDWIRKLLIGIQRVRGDSAFKDGFKKTMNVTIVDDGSGVMRRFPGHGINAKRNRFLDGLGQP